MGGSSPAGALVVEDGDELARPFITRVFGALIFRECAFVDRVLRCGPAVQDRLENRSLPLPSPVSRSSAVHHDQMPSFPRQLPCAELSNSICFLAMLCSDDASENRRIAGLTPID